jgi:hypothetical protein
MRSATCPMRITRGQMLAGMVVLITAFLFTGLSLGGGEHRALQLLLHKGIITQEEYDQAVQEEERAKGEEDQRLKQATASTKGGLQFKIGGFAELDFIDDTTRSFPEIIGNKPVVRSPTLAGANGQFVMSPRNSRLTFDVRAPEREGMKSRYFASIDFLGNQPAIGTSGVSEFSALTSPVARIFQMYFQVDTPVVDVKIGQDWSRFGFMSQYSRGSVTVAATPANMFNRWIQASLSKQLQVTEAVFVTPVFSVERPPQADAALPSFVAGVQVAHRGLQAPYMGASSSDVTLKPLSLQVTGVGRRLEANTGGPTAASGGQPHLNSQTYATGWGVSSSLFLPVLPSRDGTMGNTAHLVMEGVTGAGIADFFNGLSWGVCSSVCGNSPTNSGFGGAAFGQTNIDAGLAAVNGRTGKFEAIRTTSMMVHGTYFLPNDGKTWIGGGYGTIYSANAGDMTCSVSAAVCGGAVRTPQGIYTRDATYYAQLWHDFTPEIRAGLETIWVRTTYADAAHFENRRVQLSFFWRF